MVSSCWHLIKHYPHIPVIVMTAFGTRISRKVKDLEVVDYLEKPFDLFEAINNLQSAIGDQSPGHLKGITLFSFLQLLQIERKSCILKIKSQNKKGVLCFIEGDLYDASYKEFNGKKAASEILTWETVEIKIVKVVKKISRNIRESLQEMLLNVLTAKDEESLKAKLEAERSYDSDQTEKTAEDEILALPENNKISSVENTEKTTNKTKLEISEELKNKMASNINESLQQLIEIDGAEAVSLVDSDSGMALGTAGGGINLELAAAGSSELVKSEEKILGLLKFDDSVEDILITLGNRYHLIRPLTNHRNLFFCLILKRPQCNLAMARFKLSDVESRVEL